MKSPRCPDCRRQVLIVTATNRGSDLVLDVKPDPAGPVVLVQSSNTGARGGRFLRRDEAWSGERYRLHRDSCTAAKKRKRRPAPDVEVADFPVEQGWLPYREP